jgi:plasmid stabilization system protein ParE
MAENKGRATTISTAEFTETPRLMLEQATGDVHIEGWDRPEIEITTPDGKDYFDVEQAGSQIVIRARRGRERHRFDDQFPHGRHGRHAPHVEAPKIKIDAPGVRLDLESLGEDIGRQAERIAERVERSVERSMRRLGRHMDFDFEVGRWAGGQDFDIKVPHNCDLTLRTSTGDIRIEEVNGILYVQTASGDLNVVSIEGTALVKSASGDININGVRGKLGLRTASGDVNIHSADLQELSAQSISGDIMLDLAHVPDSGFELKTVSGDVTARIPRDARLTINVSTFSGDIDCGLPHQMERQGRGRDRILRINGGGVAATFTSVSGDISIDPGRRSEGASNGGGAPTMNMSEAQQPEAEDAADDIMEPEGVVARRQAELDILQALERGEISAQEAMNRLSELSRD